MEVSDSKIKILLNKKPPRKFDIADRDGMSLYISEFATLTFQYSYRYHDKPSRIVLGSYPYTYLKQGHEKIQYY